MWRKSIRGIAVVACLATLAIAAQSASSRTAAKPPLEVKFKWGFDDSLDVVGIHLVGGVIGTLYLGFFANGTGLFMGGDGTQLLVQAMVVPLTGSVSFQIFIPNGPWTR